MFKKNLHPRIQQLQKKVIEREKLQAAKESISSQSLETQKESEEEVVDTPVCN